MVSSLIPAFIICLERLRGKACLQNLPLLKSIFPHENTSIFPAVDASQINIQTDPRLSVFAKHHIQKSLDVDWMHLDEKGAVGCSLSHIAMWEKAIELNQPIVVIEDDVQLDETFIHTALERIPKDTEYASLIYLPYTIQSDCDDYWCRIHPRNEFGGTQMYYITPNGARTLLKQAIPIVSEIDQYIAYTAMTTGGSFIFYKYRYMTNFKAFRDAWFISQTIDHKYSIRKSLPESNGYYYTIILFVLLSWVILLHPIYSACISKSECTCRSKDSCGTQSSKSRV